MTTQKICLTMDVDLIKLIDEKRGLIPRSTYINDKINRVMQECIE